jgi:hypothetical protein
MVFKRCAKFSKEDSRENVTLIQLMCMQGTNCRQHLGGIVGKCSVSVGMLYRWFEQMHGSADGVIELTRWAVGGRPLVPKRW